jgi:hypothetical protein
MEANMTRVGQYRRILKETARALGVKQSSEAAQTAATLKMSALVMREAVQMKLLSGQLVNPDALVELEATLRELIPAAVDRSVSVTIVPSRLCPKCRCEFEAEPPPPLPAAAVPVPPPPAAVEAKSAADSTPAITRKPFAAPDNVVELVPLTNVRFGGSRQLAL